MLKNAFFPCSSDPRPMVLIEPSTIRAPAWSGAAPTRRSSSPLFRRISYPKTPRCRSKTAWRVRWGSGISWLYHLEMLDVLAADRPRMAALEPQHDAVDRIDLLDGADDRSAVLPDPHPLLEDERPLAPRLPVVAEVARQPPVPVVHGLEQRPRRRDARDRLAERRRVHVGRMGVDVQADADDEHVGPARDEPR